MEPTKNLLTSRKKGSNRYCCVVNCSNNEKKNRELHFYTFPNRPWEEERKMQWITAVRRRMLDCTSWNPTPNTRICSDHFRGGKKSNHPLEESFNPTIFPSIYNKPMKSSTSNRTQRLLARRQKNSTLNLNVSVDSNEDMTSDVPTMVQYHDIAVQTEMTIEVETEDEIPWTFYCWQNPLTNEASTQASIVLRKKASRKVIVVPQPKQTRTVCVGPENPCRIGFLGYEDLNDDQSMKQLAGITLSFFEILLTFIQQRTIGQPAYYRTLDPSNRLLLFLMKMKLGLTFAAIGHLFKVSRTTATKIFDEILTTLYENTRTWIFWPSREAIKETMPSTFRNYPSCRAIIDCTELHCDTPPSVEQRVQMYSTYKSGFTVKYLIAISPSGMITFISKGYGGKSTDGFIVNDSGFLELVEPGDQIMADKGFPQIRTALLERQCVLVMPPSATNPQSTREEVLEGYSIASVRMHVERVIQRVKIFEILRNVNIEIFRHIDKIMYIACVLANNKEPIFRCKLDDDT